MKSLLKFTIFCLIFCGISELSFGQVDSTNARSRAVIEMSYVDSTILKGITVLESDRTENGKIEKIKNKKNNEISTLVHEYTSFFREKELLANIGKIRYPNNALRNGISGTVVSQFTITENGEVTDIKILKGAHESLNNEILRFISTLPRQVPGKINGKPVPVVIKITYPFKFI